MNKAATKKTDNSYIEAKIRLRMDNLPDSDLKVLDCYAGSGLIWNRIKQELPERDIKILSIDQKRQGGIHLQGDNRKFLESLDLTQFDVIDLDAYGVPYRQLKTIFSKQTRDVVVIFVTFIQSQWGRLPMRMLRDIGYSAAMIRRCPSLFDRHGWEKFKLWLAMNGIEQIKHYSRSQKHYLCFIIKK
jgi:hypothetical protein